MTIIPWQGHLRQAMKLKPTWPTSWQYWITHHVQLNYGSYHHYINGIIMKRIIQRRNACIYTYISVVNHNIITLLENSQSFVHPFGFYHLQIQQFAYIIAKEWESHSSANYNTLSQIFIMGLIAMATILQCKSTIDHIQLKQELAVLLCDYDVEL